MENAVAVARNFLRAGLDVILSYPLSRSDYGFVRSRFEDVDAECIAITLYADRSVGKTNRGCRELTEWERNRIDWMHDHGLARPGIGPLIDTTRLTVEETVAEVLRLAGLKCAAPMREPGDAPISGPALWPPRPAPGTGGPRPAG
jgi:hypothetical protein